MATSPQALFKLLVQKVATVINPDSQNSDISARGWTYGEVVTQPMVRKSHALAEEQNYYVANNTQTAIAPTYNVAYTGTAPFILITNNNTTAKNVSIDYIALTAAVAGTFASGGVQTSLTIVVDTINRYTSGGTALIPVNVNSAASANVSNVTIFCGAITSPAPGPNARTIVGQRNVRLANSATVIGNIGDVLYWNFGGVEASMSGSYTVTNPSIVPQPLPPIVLAPGATAAIHINWPGSTTPGAATYLPEIGFWVR